MKTDDAYLTYLERDWTCPNCRRVNNTAWPFGRFTRCLSAMHALCEGCHTEVNRSTRAWWTFKQRHPILGRLVSWIV